MSRMNSILDVLKDNFPKQFNSSKYGYKVCKDDLDKIFSIINEYVFREKLDKEKVDINVVEYNGQKDKGQFALGKEDLSKCVINIIAHPIGDNFSLIVSVLCHEMIHMYDLYYGNLRRFLTKIRENAYSMDVKNVNGKQYVGEYDVHSEYFTNFIKIFDSFRIIVKNAYNINDIKLFIMKEQLENEEEYFKFFKDDTLNEAEVPSELSNTNEKKFVEMAAKGLGRDYKFIDDSHWYIRID